MKRFLTLLVMLSFFGLFGCAKTTPANVVESTNTGNAAERQTYENKTDGFSLQYPGDRTFQEKVYGSSVMFFSPTDTNDKLRENVGIVKESLDKEYSLDDYYTVTKEQLSGMIPDFSEVSNKDITINDIAAKEIIYKGTQGDMKLEWKQVYLIQNMNVYVITYTAAESTFDEFSAKVDEMAATLEIK